MLVSANFALSSSQYATVNIRFPHNKNVDAELHS